MSGLTRREFLRAALAGGAGLTLLPALGCGTASRKGVLGVPPEGYPLVAVEGSYGEIGFQLGSAMREPILEFFGHSGLFARCRDFVEGEGRRRVEAMLAHARAVFPHLVEEARGMAEALEVPFLVFFAYQCRSEIEVLAGPPGCSTLALSGGGRFLLAHNEDGSDLEVGRMYVARVAAPSGRTFVTFVYPGLIPGNGPGFNDAGIVQTTNFIEPHRVADGVPRYFVGRSILEANDLDEAVTLATVEPRAFSWHHNLGSLVEGRLLSVETVADPRPFHDVIEVEGFFLHTNHFVHPDLAPGDPAGSRPFDKLDVSTRTRWDVLSRAVEEEGFPTSAEDLMGLLSRHGGGPYGPCRHPEGEVRGATLGAGLFDSNAGGMSLYHGNPCGGRLERYELEPAAIGAGSSREPR
ncbi:MAG: C45 family peptidase [Candidatus Eisenbacteria bacterium]